MNPLPYRHKLLAIVLCVAPSLNLQGQHFLDFSTGKIRITIPRRSQPVPVQRLNREGVELVKKRQYEKAESRFLQAYLYDPSDPFTLNNLGYVAELGGDIERASKYYELSQSENSEAIIDRSSDQSLKGRPMVDALATIKNSPMKVNRMNVYAVRLLSLDRGFDAEALLKQALTLDPSNPFTLNNLGTAQQLIGNFPDALAHYQAAAALHSGQPVIVTTQRSARGKPISEVAAVSANKLKTRMANMDPAQMRAQMLTIRGVAAINGNDWKLARECFEAAYQAAPESGYALNNLGFVAEQDGERETAVTLYSRARQAEDASVRIGTSNHAETRGEHLADLAQQNRFDVNAELHAKVAERGSDTLEEPVVLLHRDGSPVTLSTPSQHLPETPKE